MNRSGLPGERTLIGWLLAVTLAAPLSLSGAEPAGTPSPPPSQQADDPQAQRQQRIDERNRLDLEAKAHIAAAEWSEAISSAEQMLALEQEVFGEKHNDTAASHRMLAELYALSGDAETARRHEDEQLASIVSDNDHSDWRVRGARQHRKLIDRMLELDDAQRGDLARGYAAFYRGIRSYQAGQYEEARAAAAEAAESYQKLLGDDFAATADSAAWLGYAQSALELRDDACASWQRAAEIFRKGYGENCPDEAVCLQSIGVERSKLDQFDQAAEAFRRAWEIRIAALGADDDVTRGSLASLIEATGDLAEQREDRGELPGAIESREQVLELVGKQYPPGDWHVVDARVNLAATKRLAELSDDQRKRLVEAKQLREQASDLYRNGKSAEALPLIEKAYAIRREILGPDDPQTASTANLLAILVDDEDFDRGVELFNEVLASWQAAKGPEHPDVGLVLSNLAVTYEDHGDLDEAASRCRRALSIYDQAYGKRGRSTLGVVDQLARLLRDRARKREAAADFAAAQNDWREVVQLCQRRHGESDWHVRDDQLALEGAKKRAALSAAQLQQLATATEQAETSSALLGQRKPAEAVEPAAQALKTRASLLGDDDPATNSARLLLAITYRRQEKIDEAAPLMKQVLEAAERIYGPDHPEYAKQVENQGHIELAQGHLAAAADYFRRAYQIRLRTLGRDNTNTTGTANNLVDTLERLATALENKQDFEAARPPREELVELRAALSGPDHWLTADARWALALNEQMAKLSSDDRAKVAQAEVELQEATRLAKEKKFNAAIAAVEKAARLRKEALGDQSRLYAVARHRLGLATLDRGDVKLALSVLEPNLELIKQTFGPLHPSHAYGLNVVASILTSQGELGRAIAMRRQARQILTEAKGAKHDDTVAATNNLLDGLARLAAEQDAQTDLAPAKATWEEILALRIEQFGEKDWRTNDARWGLYRTQLLPTLSGAKRADLAKAEQWMARADFFLAQQAELAKTNGNEAKQYQAAQSAEEAARSALALRRKVFGDGNPVTADALDALAAAESLLGQSDRVAANYKASLDIRKKLQGEKHPAYGKTRASYLQAVAETAARPFERPSALTAAQKQRLLVRDRHVAAASQAAREGNMQGEYREIEAALRIEQEVYGPTHEEVALSYERLANLAEQMRDPTRTRQNWSKLAEVRTKLNGPDSWQAAEARFYLSSMDMLSKLSREQWSRVTAAIELPDKIRDKASLGVGNDKGLETALQASEAVRRVLLDIFGENSIYYANCLDGQAAIYSRLGNEDEAEALYSKATEITGRIFTTQHPMYLTRLTRLSLRYRGRATDFQQAGDFNAAEKFWKKRLELQKRRYGENHWRVTDARMQVERNARLAKLNKEQRDLLHDIDLQLRGLGNITPTDWGKPQGNADSEARKPQKTPIEQWQANYEACRHFLGEEDPSAIACLGKVAAVCELPRDEANKCATLRKQLGLSRKTFGPDHPATAKVANELGLLYYARGDYVQAEPLLREARETLNSAGQTDYPEYSASINNLAVLYEAMGDGDRAEPLLLEVVKLQLIPDDVSIDPDEDDFAAVAPKYESLMAEFNVAEALETKTVSVPAPWSPDYSALAKYVNNLALLSQAEQDLPKAESLLRQTLGLLKAGHRKIEDYEYLTGLANLAVVCEMRGDLDQAEALLEWVVSVRRSDKYNREKFAQSLSNLGAICFQRGDFERAGELWSESLDVRKSVLGERHPNSVISLANLAVLDDRGGRLEAAADKLERVLDLAAANLQFASAIQSERQQLIMSKTLRGYLDQMLSLSTRTQISADDVYRHVLRWKGMVSARQQRMRALRQLAESDPASPVAALSHELDDVNRQLAAIAFSDYGMSESKRKEFGKLQLRRDDLERQLAGASSPFARAVQAGDLTISQFRDHLPPNSALVDLVDYAHVEYPPEPTEPAVRTRRLAAFVVRPGQPTQLVDLGESQRIETLVTACRELWTTGRTDAEDDPPAALRRLLWEPLSERLADAETVFISPDGASSRLAWAALPGKEPGSYLIEDVALAVVPVPQLLADAPRNDAAAGMSGGMLLLGDVDFDAQPGGQGDISPAAPRSSKLAAFEELPGTAQEIDAVAKLYAAKHKQAPAQLLRASEATESAFREQAPGMAFLHLATHGFFAPAEFKSNDADDFDPLLDESDSTQSITGWNPGLLSGVVMAGVNRPIDVDTDDGILTASEVAALDLSAAQLVVLSACETGLGEIAGGEGALGLQRAFQTAGAGNVVSSLWKVDDAATVLLMSEFYKNLWQRQLPPRAAFREAQLSLLRGKVDTTKLRGLDLIDDTPKAKPTDGRLPPRLWAAFVISGSM